MIALNIPARKTRTAFVCFVHIFQWHCSNFWHAAWWR